MRPRTVLAGLVLAAAGAALAQGHDHHGHGAEDDAPQGAGLAPAPEGMHAQLQDVVRPAGAGRIAWQTFWKLCWTPVAGAKGYELKRMTSEGAPRQHQRVAGPCWRVEVAAGENARAQGLYRRDLMLQLQAAQASLRVRAAFGQGRVSAWSAEHAVGEVTASAR